MAKAEFELSSETRLRLDRVCSLAEQNGWNAAINACRTLLPVEYSQRLRPLYKTNDPSVPSTDQRHSEKTECGQWIDQNYQIDRYGVALMMIGAGCADPAGLARRILSEFGCNPSNKDK